MSKTGSSSLALVQREHQTMAGSEPGEFCLPRSRNSMEIVVSPPVLCAQGISATGWGSVDASSLQRGCKIQISDGCKCSGLGGTAGGTSRAGPAPCSFQAELLIPALQRSLPVPRCSPGRAKSLFLSAWSAHKSPGSVPPPVWGWHHHSWSEFLLLLGADLWLHTESPVLALGMLPWAPGRSHAARNFLDFRNSFLSLPFVVL